MTGWQRSRRGSRLSRLRPCVGHSVGRLGASSRRMAGRSCWQRGRGCISFCGGGAGPRPGRAQAVRVAAVPSAQPGCPGWPSSIGMAGALGSGLSHWFPCQSCELTTCAGKRGPPGEGKQCRGWDSFKAGSTRAEAFRRLPPDPNAMISARGSSASGTKRAVGLVPAARASAQPRGEAPRGCRVPDGGRGTGAGLGVGAVNGRGLLRGRCAHGDATKSSFNTPLFPPLSHASQHLVASSGGGFVLLEQQ